MDIYTSNFSHYFGQEMAAKMIKSFPVLVALFLLMIINLGIYCQDDDLGLGASFIFGDSLVDAGNNNYLQTLSRANIPPNGIDFTASGGNPTGRYTNGRTIGDIVGKISFFIIPSPFFLIVILCEFSYIFYLSDYI